MIAAPVVEEPTPHTRSTNRHADTVSTDTPTPVPTYTPTPEPTSTPVSLPDLVADDVQYEFGQRPTCRVSPDDPETAPMIYRVVVRNHGTADSGRFVVDANNVAGVTVERLAVGATAVVEITGIRSGDNAITVDAVSPGGGIERGEQHHAVQARHSTPGAHTRLHADSYADAHTRAAYGHAHKHADAAPDEYANDVPDKHANTTPNKHTDAAPDEYANDVPNDHDDAPGECPAHTHTYLHAHARAAYGHTYPATDAHTHGCPNEYTDGGAYQHGNTRALNRHPDGCAHHRYRYRHARRRSNNRRRRTQYRPAHRYPHRRHPGHRRACRPLRRIPPPHLRAIIPLPTTPFLEQRLAYF